METFHPEMQSFKDQLYSRERSKPHSTQILREKQSSELGKYEASWCTVASCLTFLKGNAILRRTFQNILKKKKLGHCCLHWVLYFSLKTWFMKLMQRSNKAKHEKRCRNVCIENRIFLVFNDASFTNRYGERRSDSLEISRPQWSPSWHERALPALLGARERWESPFLVFISIGLTSEAHSKAIHDPITLLGCTNSQKTNSTSVKTQAAPQKPNSSPQFLIHKPLSAQL